jgi:hypothetical protein
MAQPWMFMMMMMIIKNKTARTHGRREATYFTSCVAAALLVTGNAYDIQTLLQPVSSQLLVTVLKICFPPKNKCLRDIM